MRDRIGTVDVWRIADDHITKFLPIDPDIRGGLWVSHVDDALMQQVLSTIRVAGAAVDDVVTDVPAQDAEAFYGDWRLVEGTGPEGAVPLPNDDRPVTLTVRGGVPVTETADSTDPYVGLNMTWAGNDGCRTYQMLVSEDEGRVEVSDRGGFYSYNLCPGDHEPGGRPFLAALRAVESWHVSADGEWLELRGDDVHLAFKRYDDPESIAIWRGFPVRMLGISPPTAAPGETVTVTGESHGCEAVTVSIAPGARGISWGEFEAELDGDTFTATFPMPEPDRHGGQLTGAISVYVTCQLGDEQIRYGQGEVTYDHVESPE